MHMAIWQVLLSPANMGFAAHHPDGNRQEALFSSDPQPGTLLELLSLGGDCIACNCCNLITKHFYLQICKQKVISPPPSSSE